MRIFVVKLLTLGNSLHITEIIAEKLLKYSLSNSVSDGEWIDALEMLGDFTAAVLGFDVESILVNVIGSEIANKIENISTNMVFDHAYSVLQNEAMCMSNKIPNDLDHIKKMANFASLSVIKNYDKIHQDINNLWKNIQIKNELNQRDIVRQFITFTNREVKNLGMMNERLKLFYFLRVDEIISLIVQTNDKKILLRELYELMNETGDLKVYNQLFLSHLTLENVEQLDDVMIHVPQDMFKLIISYCHLSIYDENDLALISTKLFTIKVN